MASTVTLFILRTVFFIAHKIRKTHAGNFSALVQRIGTASIALGLAILLVALLVLNGMKTNVEKKITGFQGPYQIVKYTLNNVIEAPPIPMSKAQGLRAAFPHQIQTIRPFIHKTALIHSKTALEGTILKGIDLAPDLTSFLPYIQKGTCISSPQPNYNKEIVLSTSLAARLQVTVGDEVTICTLQETPRYRKLRVVGLYTTYIDELDEKIALCDMRLLQHLNNWTADWIGGYDIFLTTAPISRTDFAEALLDWLGYDVEVKRIEHAYPAIFDWLAIMRKNVWIYLTLILLVANSNIIAIVLIQIMERTRMIGLLKVMGATDKLIYRIFLWNNVYLILRGMWWGNLLGIGLAALQYHFQWIRLDPTYYYMAYLPITWHWSAIAVINLLMFGLTSMVLVISIAITAKARPIWTLQIR
eukprot:gene2968-3706_t